ncbi:hypothetical protein GCM10009798_43390 [Nocardioides panacihumi]|uniref:Acyl carrier protein n=1 Tax=Nocardioides panacihumi TaxID=400774 RepID=A0ABN2RZ00_9ACTN
MSADMTADDFFESLTGFDEIAIKQHFGASVSNLKDEPMDFMRALVFVAERREGKTDIQAKDAALTLTVREVLAYFPAEMDAGKAQ